MSHKIFSEIVEITGLTTIKFKYIIFETNKSLICKKCNSPLLVKRKFSKNIGHFLEIQKCSNEKCVTHKKMKRKEYWESFFPENIYSKLIKKIRENIINNHISNIDMWVNKGLSIDEAKNKISEIQSRNSKKNIKNRFIPSRENYRKKGYSEEEIDEICLTPAQVKFWIKKGYSEKDALKKVSLNQSYAAKHVDFDKRLIPLNIEYWLKKGYNIDDAILKVKERQTTFSKKICIQKYGEKKGLEILNKRNEKWLKSLYINGNMSSGYSKIW